MTLSNRHLLMGGVFVVPVFCCFIGIGAFLQVMVSAMEQRHEEEAAQQLELAEQERREAKRHQATLTELDKNSQQLNGELSEQEKRIAELLRQLALTQQEARRGERLRGLRGLAPGQAHPHGQGAG